MKTKKYILFSLVLVSLLLAACSGALSVANLPVSFTGAGRLSGASAQAAASTTVPALPAVSETNASPAASQSLASDETVAAFQGVLENIYAQVNPSVVNVEVVSTAGSQNSPFGFGNSSPTQQGLGSGFVWDTQGYIVTNNHVVDGADQISVTFADGKTVSASLVGTDPNSDLAVLKVDVPASELHPVTLMDSSQVKVGQLAIAIGNPYGLSGTMTSGIISALSRTLPVGLDTITGQSGPRYSIPDIIQTDASINPGNSGGVLVNDQGQLIGVTAAIQSTSGANSGIGFVIPANIVKNVVPSLIQTGQADHSWLGISGTTLTPDLAQQASLPDGQQGVLVLEVTQNGTAEKDGLRGSSQQVSAGSQQVPTDGDVIVAIDGQLVTRFEDLVSYLFNQTQVGQKVSLTVLRQGKQQTFQVTLGKLPQ